MSNRPYICTNCGAIGVKLWRRYQTFADCTPLLCAICACADQGIADLVGDDGRRQSQEGSLMKTDQIGWMVPAVPTEDGETY